MSLKDRIESFLTEGSFYMGDNKKTYYQIRDARRPLPIEEVMRRWVEEGKKAEDETKSGQHIHGLYDMRDVWPYREFEWTRELSRDGFVDGKFHKRGEDKWDKLVEVMRSRGWSDKYPVEIEVGRNGQAKVGEGNHRLATARVAGVRKVPVVFKFKDRVTGHQYKSPRGPLTDLKSLRRSGRESDEEISKRQEREDRKRRERERKLNNMSPDERDKLDKQVDDIMGLFGK